MTLLGGIIASLAIVLISVAFGYVFIWRQRR